MAEVKNLIVNGVARINNALYADEFYGANGETPFLKINESQSLTDEEKTMGKNNLGVTDVAFVISDIDNNVSSITLNSTAARTYQKCILTYRTNITLSGGRANAGYEHYLLIYNNGQSDCIISKSSNMIGPNEMTVSAGKKIEISWVYNGSDVILTASEILS